MMLPLLAFVFGSLLVAATGMKILARRGGVLEERLAEITGDRIGQGEIQTPRYERVSKVLKQVGNKVPRSPSEMGKLRLRLVQAGYRGDEALPLFFGIRIACALGAFALFSTPILMSPNLALALGSLLLAYLLPGIVLARMAKRRQHRLQLALADALDLLVVSVEAGLGLDQAMLRVGEELEFAYPDLSDELRLVNLELRAGKPRIESLRNLSERTGVEDIGGLVTMLVQTDRFRYQHLAIAACALGHAQDEAAAAGRRGRCEDRRQDGLPARVLYLPGHLGRDHRSGGHQVRYRAVPAGQQHEEVERLLTRVGSRSHDG